MSVLPIFAAMDSLGVRLTEAQVNEAVRRADEVDLPSLAGLDAEIIARGIVATVVDA